MDPTASRFTRRSGGWGRPGKPRSSPRSCTTTPRRTRPSSPSSSPKWTVSSPHRAPQRGQAPARPHSGRVIGRQVGGDTAPGKHCYLRARAAPLLLPLSSAVRVAPAVVAALAAALGAVRPLPRTAADAAVAVGRPLLHAGSLRGQFDRSLERTPLGDRTPARCSGFEGGRYQTSVICSSRRIPRRTVSAPARSVGNRQRRNATRRS